MHDLTCLDYLDNLPILGKRDKKTLYNSRISTFSLFIRQISVVYSIIL